MADENKPLQYLRYALGEIVLIVIGILIALQINDWNINKENQALEQDLLKGIQSDLVADTLSMSTRFYPSYQDLKQSIDRYDSILEYKDSEINLVFLDSIFARCIRQRNTIWPTSGTYQTIINNSSSPIFSNKRLFKGFQNIYEKNYKIVVAAGERIDDLSDQNRYKYNYVATLNDQERLDFYRNPTTRNEIKYWFAQLDHFNALIDYLKNFARSLILQIEEELVQ